MFFHGLPASAMFYRGQRISALYWRSMRIWQANEETGPLRKGRFQIHGFDATFKAANIHLLKSILHIHGSDFTTRQSTAPLATGHLAVHGNAMLHESVATLAKGHLTLNPKAATLGFRATLASRMLNIHGNVATLALNPTAPLDGLPTPTSAMSVDRELFTAFAGGTKYTTAGGAVDSAKDQTGATHHWNQSSTGLKPVISTLGSHSRACMSFDGVDDYMVNAVTLPSLISVSDGLVVQVIQIAAISTDSGTPYANNPAFGDNGGYVGIGYRSGAFSNGSIAYLEAFNFNGSSWNKTPIDSHILITTGGTHVLMWRHTGGNLYLSIDGGTEVSVAASNIGSYAGVTMTLGKNAGGGYAQIKLAEMVTWNGTMPNSTQLAAYIANCVAFYN